MRVAVIILAWIVFGTVAYGLQFHYFQERFKFFAVQSLHMHRLAAALCFITGPLGLIAAALTRWSDAPPRTPWGLRYRRVSDAESWAAYHELFPSLTQRQWREGM